MNFLEWESMIACGATMTEILEWERGCVFIPGIDEKTGKPIEKFPVWFKAKILAFHELAQQKAMHVQDAATPKKK